MICFPAVPAFVRRLSRKHGLGLPLGHLTKLTSSLMESNFALEWITAKSNKKETGTSVSEPYLPLVLGMDWCSNFHSLDRLDRESRNWYPLAIHHPLSWYSGPSTSFPATHNIVLTRSHRYLNWITEKFNNFVVSIGVQGIEYWRLL